MKYKLKINKLVESIIHTFGLIILYNTVQIITLLIGILNNRDSFLNLLFEYKTPPFVVFILDKLLLNGEYNKNYVVVFFGLISILLLIELFIFFKLFWGKKLLVLEHFSLSNMKFSYDDALKKEYSYKVLPINQVSLFENTSFNNGESVSNLIRSIDEKVFEISKYIDKNYLVGYAGIANIPATLLLGFKLGDENKYLLFQSYRNTQNNAFQILKYKNSQHTLEFKDIQDNNNSDEVSLIVLISLSFEIHETEWKKIANKNDYIAEFYTMNKSYDIIESQKQVDEYCLRITEYINTKQSNSNIKNIKLCIAAPSSFVFSLGTRLSKTHNKEIIVFHFENFKYSWGINVTKEIPFLLEHKDEMK